MKNWDLEVALLTQNGTKKNKIGDTIPMYQKVTVLGYEKPLSRAERYLAGQSNIPLSKMIVVHPFEYENQQLVEVGGKAYQVENSYKLSNEEIELKLVNKRVIVDD